MPEDNYIGHGSSRTSDGPSMKVVYVKVPKLRFFMEPSALSFAPAQSILTLSGTATIPKPTSSAFPKDIGIVSQMVKAPNPIAGCKNT